MREVLLWLVAGMAAAGLIAGGCRSEPAAPPGETAGSKRCRLEGGDIADLGLHLVVPGAARGHEEEKLHVVLDALREAIAPAASWTEPVEEPSCKGVWRRDLVDRTRRVRARVQALAWGSLFEAPAFARTRVAEIGSGWVGAPPAEEHVLEPRAIYPWFRELSVLWARDLPGRLAARFRGADSPEALKEALRAVRMWSQREGGGGPGRPALAVATGFDYAALHPFYFLLPLCAKADPVLPELDIAVLRCALRILAYAAPDQEPLELLPNPEAERRFAEGRAPLLLSGTYSLAALVAAREVSGLRVLGLPFARMGGSALAARPGDPKALRVVRALTRPEVLARLALATGMLPPGAAGEALEPDALRATIRTNAGAARALLRDEQGVLALIERSPPSKRAALRRAAPFVRSFLDIEARARLFAYTDPSAGHTAESRLAAAVPLLLRRALYRSEPDPAAEGQLLELLRSSGLRIFALDSAPDRELLP